MEQNGPLDETPLYRPGLLKEIDFSEAQAKFKGSISPSNPGENLVMRPLCAADYDKGFMEVLKQLTKCGDTPREKFLARYNQMKSCPNTYFVTVIEDISKSKIIATGTVVLEQKFIRGCAERSRIEDLVVDDEYRGLQLGKLMFQTLLLLSQHLGVYKCSLECLPENIAFYENLDFKVDPQSFMQYRFKELS
ncbi:glucosamine 6-phosphate N-acetyltransferase-like isoform X2 [Ptychodera flava]|uniref:glucosamine 6-phosphate N-acetyltransferase-like isoform X2 n=1 Tax=Ptychodera flava TaxID=63121 RepID=UPI00396A9140